MSNERDSIEVYRRRRRRRNIWQHSLRMLCIVIAVILLVSGALLVGHRFLPTLSSFFDRDGDHSKGYPIALSGSSIQAGEVDGKLAVLSDSQLQFFRFSGSSVRSLPHGISNAAFSAAGKYVLVYARGGTAMLRTTVYGVPEEMEMSGDITYAQVNRKGEIMAVTGDSRYVSRVALYNDKMEEKYSYYSDIQISAAALNEDNTECAMAGLDVVNGKLQTKLMLLHTNQTVTELAVLEDVMPLSVSYQGGAISLITDKQAFSYQTNGSLLGSYTYTGQLICYDHRSDNRTALVVQDAMGGNAVLHLLDRKKAEQGDSLPVQGTVRSVLSSGGSTYVLAGSHLLHYTGGSEPETYEVPMDTTQILDRSGKLLVLGKTTVHHITDEQSASGGTAS